MSIRTLLAEQDLLSKRTLRILLESISCDVVALSDPKALGDVLKAQSFEVIIVSTLSSNCDPLLVAEQSKRSQPAARVLLWGAVIAAMPAWLDPYVDGQLTMPCSLAELKSAILPSAA